MVRARGPRNERMLSKKARQDIHGDASQAGFESKNAAKRGGDTHRATHVTAFGQRQHTRRKRPHRIHRMIPRGYMPGSRGYGSGPHKGLWVNPSYANSGVVVLPTMMAPAVSLIFQRWQHWHRGPNARRYGNPWLWSFPRVAVRSLMATGMPCSAPGLLTCYNCLLCCPCFSHGFFRIGEAKAVQHGIDSHQYVPGSFSSLLPARSLF